VGLGRFYHYEFGLHVTVNDVGTKGKLPDRGLTVELECSVDLSIGLLEGIAYAEGARIDILVGYDGLNIQFITVISNGLLLIHGIRGCGEAALDAYVPKEVRKTLAESPVPFEMLV
jgi:hypothetical protein